jgi:hypothetical protein
MFAGHAPILAELSPARLSLGPDLPLWATPGRAISGVVAERGW